MDNEPDHSDMKHPWLQLVMVCTFVPLLASAQGAFWQFSGGPANGEITGIAEGEAGSLLASTPAGIFVSSSRGSEWHLRLPGQATCILRHSSTVCFAGMVGSGVYRSDDNGKTWWHLPSSPDTVWCLTVDHKGRVVAGSNGRIAISSDRGVTWTSTFAGANEVFGMTFKPGVFGALALNGGGVYVSGDTGKTWVASNAGLDNLYVQDIAMAPNGNLFAGTRGGVFRSADNGQSWVRVSPNWGATVHKVGVTHGGQVFAVAHNGVYRSFDDGGTWAQVNDGLSVEITGAICMSGDGYVYVGTWGGGVFRSSARPDPYAHDWVSGDKPGDSFGTVLAAAGDLNGDGWPDFVVGSPYSDISGESSGSARVFFGGPDLNTGSSLLLAGPEAYDRFGFSVAGVGDLNSDGYDDIVVGAPTDYQPNGRGNSRSQTGRAYVYFGGPTMDDVPDQILTNGTPAAFGHCVAAAGDVNADGYPDVLITDMFETLGGYVYQVCSGRVHVLLGSAQGMLLKGPVCGSFHGFGTSWGRSLAGIGDFNNDGYDDIATTLWIRDEPPPEFYLGVFGGGNPMDSVADRMEYANIMEYSYLGSVLSGGDFNGDGYADILASAPGESGPIEPAIAKVRLFLGGPTFTGTGQKALVSPMQRLGFGEGATCAGDINGDGFDDVIVGIPLDNTRGQTAGGALLYLGGNPLDSLSDGALAGGAPFDRTGITVGRTGDFDGDGRLEVLLGAPGNAPGGVFAGRVYLAKIPLSSPVLPTTPVLSAPADGSIDVPVNVSLSWRRSQNTLHYHCQISQDPSFVRIAYESENEPDTVLTPAALDSATTYYWRVRAQNAAADGPWSQTWRFRTVLGFPQQVKLISPPPEMIVQPGRIHFVWHGASPGVEKYRFELSSDSSFLASVVDSAVTDTTRAMDGFSGSYWWRVSAWNIAGWGPPSAARRFHILTVPERVILDLPPAGATRSPGRATFSWRTGRPEVTRYCFELATDSVFSSSSLDSSIVDTNHTVEHLQDNTTYWWRVKAWNALGWGMFSEPRSLRIIAMSPQVALVSPQNGDILGSTVIAFIWRLGPAGTTRYWLEVGSDSLFSVAHTDSTITDTARSIAGLVLNARHWWRVKSRNILGWGRFGEARTFQLLSTPLQVVVVSPPDEAATDSNEVRFVWRAASFLVDRYWFEIATDSQFVWTARDTLVTDTVKTMGALRLRPSYWWRVRAHNPIGWGPFSETRRLTVRTTGISDNLRKVPTEYSLEQNYPNPFNPSSTIRYGLPRTTHVTLSIYNVLGQEIAVLVRDEQPAGFHEVRFDAGSVPSGVYLYRIQSGTFVATRRLLLVK
jgi:photosystem II stability/assembly factor-like uncharacterized protein